MFEIWKASCRPKWWYIDAWFISLLFSRKVGLICLLLSKVLSQVCNESNIVREGSRNKAAECHCATGNQSLFVSWRNVFIIEHIMMRIVRTSHNPKRVLTHPWGVFKYYVFLIFDTPKSALLAQVKTTPKHLKFAVMILEQTSSCSISNFDFAQV